MSEKKLQSSQHSESKTEHDTGSQRKTRFEHIDAIIDTSHFIHLKSQLLMLATSHQIIAMELGPMENFVYLIVDVATRKTAVIDPAWDVPGINKKAQELEIKITDVLLTHSHHDHINGIEELLNTHDAQVHLLKEESIFWGSQLAKPLLHHGNDQIKVGQTQIEILHTPGHTPGSACYRIHNDLITGDTLFVYGCGRCDLRGGNPEIMYGTLKRILEELPTTTVIHPGHNYAEQTTSTLEEQASGNPFMQFTDVDSFIRYRMHVHDKIRNSPYRPVSKEELSLN